MIDFSKVRATYGAPISGRSILTIDTHTAGEPLRIILGGLEAPEGHDILERRRAAAGAWDLNRQLLMHEPRGHREMYGALLLPPVDPAAAFGVLFMQNGGYSPMCGHAVIALAKVAVAMGWVAGDPDPDGRVSFNIETPAGLVRAHVCAVDGRILSASYESVPSFVQALDLAAQVSGLGAVPFDLAFGGAFYAYVDADALGLSLLPDNSRTLIDAGRTIQHTVAEQFAINHPVSVDLSFLFGTLFYGRSQGDAHSRQVTIFEDGFLDRSPTGTGVAGRMAVLHKRNAVRPQETLTFESITGGRFTGRVLSENDFAGLPAVTPEIGGNASITGRHEFILEPDDPMSVGFFIR